MHGYEEVHSTGAVHRGAFARALAFIPLILAALSWYPATAHAQVTPSVERGAYLFAAAGCAGCHTDVENKGPQLAGGRAIETPFGRFYGPNITPDPTYGIGRWSDADFIRALRQGVAPDGHDYYPVFPYTSFTKMTDADLLDLKAYIFSLPPVAKPSKPHEIAFPFGWRFLLKFWKALNFKPGPFEPDPTRGADWNRGAYLVQAVTHCGECHTPRTPFGGPMPGRFLAGGKAPSGGPDKTVPNITPSEDGIGDWSVKDIEDVLRTGILPDYETLGGDMAEVQENLAQLSDADREAIALYLKAIPPLPDTPAE